MKLIIDIPDIDLNNVKNGSFMSANILNACKNGIPLDDVKAEIEASMYCDKDTRLVKNANASGLEKAIEILDNIGKEESEE